MPTSSLIVPALAGLGGVLFLAWKPGVARSMAASPRAAGFTLGIGALVLGIGWLLPRLGRGARTTAAVQLVPVLAAALVTVAPAFRQVTVDEAFPAAVRENPRSPADAPTASAASEPSRSAKVSSATILGRGQLRGIDHRASGNALLVRRGDGSLVVRLERLDVEPGPDYQVHLVPGLDRHRPNGGVHLDRLRGNRGRQNYDVPAGQQVATPVTVLIWCRTFAVPVAAASIT